MFMTRKKPDYPNGYGQTLTMVGYVLLILAALLALVWFSLILL